MPGAQAAKAVIARGLSAPFVGSLIANARADLIPTDGLVCHTGSLPIANGTKAAIYWELYERDELRLFPNIFVVIVLPSN